MSEQKLADGTELTVAVTAYEENLAVVEPLREEFYAEVIQRARAAAAVSRRDNYHHSEVRKLVRGFKQLDLRCRRIEAELDAERTSTAKWVEHMDQRNLALCREIAELRAKLAASASPGDEGVVAEIEPEVEVAP